MIKDAICAAGILGLAVAMVQSPSILYVLGIAILSLSIVERDI